MAAGQTHLFESWSASPSEDAEEKKAFFEQVDKLNRQYPGGIKEYVEKARKMLKDKLVGANPFEGYVPHVPLGEKLTPGSKEFMEMEEKGLKDVVGHTAFVLVAGGLGERLGYSGIKVALPIDLATGDCYLKRYCEHILALQYAWNERYGSTSAEAYKTKMQTIPLFIMTSGDTHDRTVELLKRHDNFGLKKDQIVCVQQDKVPALCDNEARFAAAGKYSISTKPHGHGDVHLVLHQSETVKRWTKNGIKWIVFFQDTNGLVFHSVLAALGVSETRSFAMNSITVRRSPGEPVGAICRLVKKPTETQDGDEITINVEVSPTIPTLHIVTRRYSPSTTRTLNDSTRRSTRC